MKTCLECRAPIQGRSDKKFCDDYCRNLFNNRRSVQKMPIVRKIDAQLRRNRKILHGLLDQGKERCAYQLLISQGFNFEYYTQVLRKKDRKIYYCYDRGYVKLKEEGCFEIVKLAV